MRGLSANPGSGALAGHESDGGRGADFARDVRNIYVIPSISARGASVWVAMPRR